MTKLTILIKLIKLTKLTELTNFTKLTKRELNVSCRHPQGVIRYSRKPLVAISSHKESKRTI